MPSLVDLQRRMARAVLSGDPRDIPPTAVAPVPADVAFGVYRDTVLGALSNALRLSFPTVEQLVGEAFFRQAARAYVREAPPRRADLATFGALFPTFLETYGPAESLAYLGAVARLDWAIARALRAPDDDVRRRVALEATVCLALPVSLVVLALRHPADLIRAALEDGDDLALAAIDLTPRPRFVAIWRQGRAAAVRALSQPAGLFLAALQSASTPEDALAAACTAASPQDALLAIQAEAFAAPFAEITQIRPEEESA
jgi:hypothetical protein